VVEQRFAMSFAGSLGSVPGSSKVNSLAASLKGSNSLAVVKKSMESISGDSISGKGGKGGSLGSLDSVKGIMGNSISGKGGEGDSLGSLGGKGDSLGSLGGKGGSLGTSVKVSVGAIGGALRGIAGKGGGICGAINGACDAMVSGEMEARVKAAIDELNDLLPQLDDTMTFSKVVVTQDLDPVGDTATAAASLFGGVGEGKATRLKSMGVEISLDLHTDVLLCGRQVGLLPGSTFDVVSNQAQPHAHLQPGSKFQIQDAGTMYFLTVQQSQQQAEPGLWLAKVSYPEGDEEIIELRLDGSGVPTQAKAATWASVPLNYESASKPGSTSVIKTLTVKKSEKCLEPGLWLAEVLHPEGAEEVIELTLNAACEPTQAKAANWTGVPQNFKAGTAHKVNLRLWRTSDAGLSFGIEDDDFAPWHGCAQPKDPSKPRIALEPVHGWELTKQFRLTDVLRCVNKCNKTLSDYHIVWNNCHDFSAEFLDVLYGEGSIEGDGMPETDKSIYM